jgi:hypothetical protein
MTAEWPRRNADRSLRSARVRALPVLWVHKCRPNCVCLQRSVRVRSLGTKSRATQWFPCGGLLAPNTSASSSDAGTPLMKYHPAKTLDAVEVSLVKSLPAAIGANPFALALRASRRVAHESCSPEPAA